MKYSAPSNKEINDVLDWLNSEPNIPSHIVLCLKKILSVYSELLKGASKAKQVLHILRQAMGILPKSEKGSQETQMVFPELTEETQKTVDDLLEKKAEAEKQREIYSEQLKKLISPPKDPLQLEFDLEPPDEKIFSWPSGDRKSLLTKEKVDRMHEFGKEVGLRSTFDVTKRVDLEIIVTDIKYEVETVEDIHTGKKVRASMIKVGPPQFQFTWKAIANLIKLHVGFAIPINRISLLIGQPEFTSSKICRVLEYVATQLLPVYLTLAEKLSDVSLLNGDDTVTKVLELDEPNQTSLASQIDEHLTWASQKADGSGVKKALNVSLIIGKTEKDPRSTIRFFRTHTGSVGNLMTKLLEWRNPLFKSLIFQGDMSSTNLPSKELQNKFNLIIAGCGAHARRPFWRYRDQDENLCYFMLRGFLMLSQLEKRIELRGRSSKVVLKYRSRYGRMIWIALKNRCHSAIEGKVMSQIPPKFGTLPRMWPNGMDLNKACKYIINNFEALTLYLTTPELHYTNNQAA